MATYARLKNGDAIEVTDIRNTSASTPFGASEGIRLANTKYLYGRNAANSADVSICRVNASNQVEFGNIPYVSGNPSAALQLAAKQYVDLFLTTYNQQELTTLISTTSASYVDYTSSSVTITCVAGQILQFGMNVQVSANTVGAKVRLALSLNAVDQSVTAPWDAPISATDGAQNTLSLSGFLTPVVGVNTLKIRWRVATGTAHSQASRLWVKAFKNT